MTRHDRPEEGRPASVGTPGQDSHPHRQTDMLGWARGYAARGWPVLAIHSPAGGGCTCGRSDCSSPAKHPRGARGVSDATTDPDTITAWWTRWPNANIGLRTGVAFDVLDLDGPGALDALALAELGQPDDTATDIAAVIGPMVLTGRGVHVLVEPTGARNHVGLTDHVDWRATGGYAVAPPSVHATGAVYEWGSLYGIDTPLRPAPEWLADVVTRPKPAPAAVGRLAGLSAVGGSHYGLASLEGELGRLATAAEGTRNDALNRAAFRVGQLVSGGELAALHAVGELLTVAARIGLGEAEAERTVASGMTAGAGAPRSAA